MGNSLAERLTQLESKMLTLVSQRDKALSELKAVRQENASLNQQLISTRSALEESRMEAEYLSVSHKLADNPQALAEARQSLRKMIARVEKAIRLLEDDARI